jgi:hypothetical protein
MLTSGRAKPIRTAGGEAAVIHAYDDRKDALGIT